MNQVLPLRSNESVLSLVAPVDGAVFPLDAVPDPVFADKMLGDGVAIDPIGSQIVAPCSGVVSQIHRAKHALTIENARGVSVLVHVGIDTVRMSGEGFSPLIVQGSTVRAGQPLLDFDLDLISRKAASALTAVIVTAGGDSFPFRLDGGVVSSGVEEILRVASSGVPTSRTRQRGVSSPSADCVSSRVALPNPNGMHARPAARLVRLAKGFDAQLSLSARGRTASATSVSDIMALDLAKDDEVEIGGVGSQAAAAVEAIRRAIAEGLGEKLASNELASNELVERRARFVATEAGTLGGVPAAPGLGVGTAQVLKAQLPEFADRGDDPSVETTALHEGLRRARADLVAEERSCRDRGLLEQAQVFSAHGDLLDDAGMVADCERRVKIGASAARAFHDAVRARTERLDALRNPLLRQRATDMKDVGERVIYAILKRARPSLELCEQAVIVCDDLTPSTLAALPAERIAAIVSEAGGATSHAAIIARSMDVPYVAAVSDACTILSDGQVLIVDGYAGALQIEPDDAARRRALDEIERIRSEKQAQRRRAQEPAVTKDGRHVEVAANIGDSGQARVGVDNGCDAVGLLRSEFLFLDRRSPPSETEQKREYTAIAEILGFRRSLVVRTLDVGGDKPLPYIDLPAEENPFLGIRGLRVSFKYPELFRSQIRAALAAAEFTKLNLMFPMVARRDEFLRAQAIVRHEMHTMGIVDNVAVGVMVEVPSAALNAHWLAKEVDFFSIGTNDLTQYTLAMDRGHPELSDQADALDPAVLRLIQLTVQAAHGEGKWVGVCGGIAADPEAVALLIGLDVDELSVPGPVIPELKERIRRLSADECRKLAKEALLAPSGQAVRKLMACCP